MAEKKEEKKEETKAPAPKAAEEFPTSIMRRAQQEEFERRHGKRAGVRFVSERQFREISRIGKFGNAEASTRSLSALDLTHLDAKAKTQVAKILKEK